MMYPIGATIYWSIFFGGMAFVVIWNLRRNK